ncbi:MarR family transcriptional regulator [Pseudorhizobium halotolerans]|uniref:MarR family transcriptional regulator n=1 Tax=Pseudorhizobium halotolerans TaxID=1233081 RepID=A0ABM8PTL5_9HYPH|nr:MarR family transcriptional regulator [Pseudorhizobium halotolerans]
MALTDEGCALQHKAGCLGDTLLAAATRMPKELAALNHNVRRLRNAVYSQIGGWDAPAGPWDDCSGIASLATCRRRFAFSLRLSEWWWR